MKFKTKRLIIRRFHQDDWLSVYNYLSNPIVVKYEPYNVYTEKECQEFVLEQYHLKEKSPFFAVCLTNGKLIGQLFFSQKEPKSFKTWNIGYVFNPTYYGKGYATEACKCIMKHAFESLHAHRIVAGVNVNNKASWHLLERLNMRKEAHMIKNAYNHTKDGQPVWHDSYQYAILESEWKK